MTFEFSKCVIVLLPYLRSERSNCLIVFQALGNAGYSKGFTFVLIAFLQVVFRTAINEGVPYRTASSPPSSTWFVRVKSLLLATSFTPLYSPTLPSYLFSYNSCVAFNGYKKVHTHH